MRFLHPNAYLLIGIGMVLLASYAPPLNPYHSTGTPLVVPWPLLMFGTRLVDWMHSCMLQLAPPQIALFWFGGSFVKTGALRAAAKLKIADALNDGPQTIQYIANCTSSYAPHVERLLLALETINCFRQLSDGRWVNTAISEYLVEKHPESMREAILMFGEEQYVSFSRLDYAIQTGKSAFQHVYGDTFWTYMNKNTASQQVFQGSLTGLSFLVDHTLVLDYPSFKEYETIIDIAGGQGAMLQRIMEAYTHLKGVLFEQAQVIDSIQDKWTNGPYVNRTLLVRGDFFDDSSLPSFPSRDAYLLKQVLHHFDETDASVILKNIHSVMDATDVLLVADRMITRGATFVGSHGSHFVDLLMMSNFGLAGERSPADFYRLLLNSGFELIRIVPTRSAFYLLECRPVKINNNHKNNHNSVSNHKHSTKLQRTTTGSNNAIIQ